MEWPIHAPDDSGTNCGRNVDVQLLRRLREESVGQGVIEVLAVFGVFGVLVAQPPGVRAQVCSAVPAAQIYRAHHGSYAGLDTVDLSRIDPRISMTLVVSSSRSGGFCLTESVGSRVWSLSGPVKGTAKYTGRPSCGRG